MTDLLRQGRQWLAGMLKQHASSPVTYRRGETDLAITATFGSTQYEVQDDFGLKVRAEVMDFLIAAEDLASLGQPQPGDRIVAPSTGSGQADSSVYEVLDLAGQGHWRWSDPHKTTMRIHTKEVG